jgi:prepilin-type N-terminal cleavage/methylation domain-containing protein
MEVQQARASRLDHGFTVDDGFTLVEIVVAIVLVGILSAVVVVGVSNLTGEGAGAACTSSRDAAKAATLAYWATTRTQPATFDDLVGAGSLELAEGVTVHDSGVVLLADGWSLRITASAGGAVFTCAAPVPDGFTIGPTGHYYRFVPAQVSWAQAVALAAEHTAGGETGYLATITSQAEHDTMLALIGDVHSAWLGGTDAATEGEWYWVTGPEAGTRFSTWSTPAGGAYTRWATNEPNNDGNQDCLHLWRPSGHRWDDVQCVYGSTSGYIIEIGG